MFDRQLTQAIRPLLMPLARTLRAARLSPDHVTTIGLVVGLGAAVAISAGHLWTGLVLILISRLADGLDGMLARMEGRQTHFGGFLDIVFDFLFYGAIPLAFAILDPAANAVAASVLLLSFYANGGSVLAYAVMAERSSLAEKAGRGGKSLMFTIGLMEGGETLLFFVLFCLFPAYFPWLAALFAALTAATFVARVQLAFRTLGLSRSQARDR